MEGKPLFNKNPYYIPEEILHDDHPTSSKLSSDSKHTKKPSSKPITTKPTATKPNVPKWPLCNQGKPEGPLCNQGKSKGPLINSQGHLEGVATKENATTSVETTTVTVKKNSIEISGKESVQTTVKNSVTISESKVSSLNTRVYPTQTKWNLSYHLNSNKSYRVADFVKMLSISNLKEFWELHNNLDKINNLKDKNYYLMREGITPTKEDPKNRNGTIISIAIPDEIMVETWVHMAAIIIGEEFSKKNYLVNGLCIKYINDNKPGRKNGMTKGNAGNNPLSSGPFGLIKVWLCLLDKDVTDYIKVFLKTIIPKYINPKYEGFNYSTQLMNIQPEF